MVLVSTLEHGKTKEATHMCTILNSSLSESQDALATVSSTAEMSEAPNEVSLFLIKLPNGVSWPANSSSLSNDSDVVFQSWGFEVSTLHLR